MIVELTSDAAQDLDEYLTRIDADDEDAALRVHARVVALLELLAARPGLGRLRRLRGLARRARVFALTPLPLLAIYQETTTGIVVLRLYHGAREPLGA